MNNLAEVMKAEATSFRGDRRLYRLGIKVGYGGMDERYAMNKTSGAPNEYSWQISAPQPAYSWLARETGQIQNPSWQTENLTIL